MFTYIGVFIIWMLKGFVSVFFKIVDKYNSLNLVLSLVVVVFLILLWCINVRNNYVEYHLLQKKEL